MSDLRGVAIVGVAGRWPGATGVEEFWGNLTQGVESISFFSRDELIEAGVPEHVLAHPGYVGASSVLRDVDQFDAPFFGLAPREAALLDPQGRLFMECAWEAMEDAGYVPDGFDGLIGVFGGVGATRYFTRNLLPAAERLDGAGAYQAMVANDKDFIPAWTSYKLNLTGPSVAVQTACSTSLVATHLACQSLLTYECDMAVAGGVSLSLDEVAGYVYQEGGILSPDGHCRPFDARAKGTVHGSGAAMVALRRLEDAVSDGDAILAVIRGSAINNDGAVKVGFTAPGVDGQAEVIAMAHAVAEVDADTIGFVEGHGTGTPLGDPVEVSALTRVFRRQTTRRNFCALGSVKSNVGHLDAAAGVTGLIKATLAVANGQIPPTVHFERPNPDMDLASSPFFVNAQTQDWPSLAGPRRAAVSSFGIGGTNAHALLEEAPARRVSGPSRSWQVLPVSARTATALDTATELLADTIDAYVEANDELPLADVAYTLAVGRKALTHRRVVACREAEEALEAIDGKDPARVYSGIAAESSCPVTFMFPGQGSEYVNMARDLYTGAPVFRAEFDRCAELQRATSGKDLVSLVFPALDAQSTRAHGLDGADVCQPALFAVEYALARLMIASGVTPQSYIGHSVGEYVAACLAGVFTLEDALSVVAARGRLIQTMPSGAMLAVSASEQRVKQWIDPASLSVAAVNSPNACVIAGTAKAVDDLATVLADEGILHRRLQVSHAFHSHMMDAALDPFRSVMGQVTLSAPHTPFISNVTGNWIRAEEATDQEYWVNQLRRTVYFSDGLGEVLKDPCRVAVEVGPGRTLHALALQQRTPGGGQEVVALLPDARDSRSCAETVAVGVGRLWLAGADVDWVRYYDGETRNRVRLATYPFERERHWIAPPDFQPTPSVQGKRKFSEWFWVPAWKQAPIVPKSKFYAQSLTWLVVADSQSELSELARAVTLCLRSRDQAVTLTMDSTSLIIPSELDRVICFPATFASALALMQSVAEGSRGRPIVVDFVQAGVQSVTGDESISAERATVLGLSRVLPQEFSDFRTRHVDVMVPEDPGTRERLVGQLLEEFTVEPASEQVAYRGRMRWMLEHEPVSVPEENSSGLRERGVYWITGGTGGIGLSLAEHLASACRARLVLTSRTGPAVDGTVLTQIRHLESLGSEVLVIQADVSSAVDMARVAADIAQRFGEVNGVIHAAGVPGGKLAALETTAGAEMVMSPKIAGATHLENVLGQFSPDFVIFCSSLAVQLGGLGQAAYASANAFLDATARQHRWRDGRLTVSVNWDRWRGVGMAASFPGSDAIGSEEGGRALETILMLGMPEVAVSTLDLRTREMVIDNAASQGPSGTVQPRPPLSSDYVRPTDPSELELAAIWQDILGLESVGIDDNFFELGGDSLTALRLMALYQERTSVAVPVTALYTAPTIGSFLATVRGISVTQVHDQALHGDVR
jgi:phthiocerol/phenolphthiocerol synthesis type-I polyketide synthase E